MGNFLIFMAGFFSALVFVAATVVVGAVWWFLSYGRHLKAKQEIEKIAAAKMNRRVPMIRVETEDL